MAITEALKTEAKSLRTLKEQADETMKQYREGLKNLYELFLKKNGLHGYICHKANVGIGEQARAVLYVKEWSNGNIEIRYQLANEVHDMENDYPACCRHTTDPVEVMQEILNNYVPYYNFKNQE